MIFYALVSDDSAFAIDLYPSREQAEQALQDVLADEPTFRELIRVEPVELATAEPIEPPEDGILSLN